MGIKILEGDLNVIGTIQENNVYLSEKYATKNNLNELSQQMLKAPESSQSPAFTVQSFLSSTRAMRLFGLSADQIIIEHSTDGGATWVDAQCGDAIKTSLFNQSRSYTPVIPLKNGVKSCDCLLRITITAMKYNVPENTPETDKYNYWNAEHVRLTERYCTLDFGYFWINANADAMYIEHQHALVQDPNTWITDGVLSNARGWSGGNYIKFSGRTFGGNVNQLTNSFNHRFIFRTQATDGSFNDSQLNQSYLSDSQYIYEISCYGQNCWVSANKMMETDHAYYINNDNQVVFNYNMYINGILNTSQYITTTGHIYTEGSVYATNGFVFRGQADADKKLLTADGWWKHIDTFATADAVSSLEENTKIMNTSSKTPQVGDIIHANTLLDSINSLTDSGASFSMTYYIVNAKTNTGNGKIYWYEGAWYFDWYDDSGSQYLKNEMIVIPIDVRVVSIDYTTEPDPACEIIVFENYQLTAQQAYNMTNEKLNKSPKIVGYFECDNGNFIASGSVWPYAGLINKMCCIKAIYIPKEEYIGATTTVITNIDTEHFGIEYWEPGENIRGTIWISMCQYDDGGIQIAIGGHGDLDINNVAFEIYTL